MNPTHDKGIQYKKLNPYHSKYNTNTLKDMPH